MTDLYPDIEPHASGLLPVGGHDELYWEACGNPRGKPAVVLHGGPGSGCSAWHRRLFDPALYNVVLFDQRNCGRSRPHASDPATGLSANRTDSLVADIERLRSHLGVGQWLVLGGSWGSCLGLLYAESFPKQVSELVLFGVATGRREEFDRLFRHGLSDVYPEASARRQVFVDSAGLGGDPVEAFNELLMHPERSIRERAAFEWCLWESSTSRWPSSSELAPRFQDPTYAVCFARIVTHYARHDAWIGDGRVLDGVEKLQEIPGALICGRQDAHAPAEVAYEIHQRWPASTLVVVDKAGHSADHRGITREIVGATDRFGEGRRLGATAG